MVGKKAYTASLIMAGLFSLNTALDFDNNSTRKECFRHFDKDSKQYLNKADFHSLVKQLVTGKPEPSIAESNEFFTAFDTNADGKIDAQEFASVWNNWVKKLLKPVTALLVVDVQNDFIVGSLAMSKAPAHQDGYEVVPVINKMIENIPFHAIAYSLDYHPPNHISFYDNLGLYPLSKNFHGNVSDIKMFDTVLFAGPPEMEQILWPTHCVQGSQGAEFNPDLKVVKDAIIIHKGTKPEIDSYSAFWDNMKLNMTNLHEELQKRQVTHVFVSGIAYDICVASTALSALELGYATVLVQDASRGIDLMQMENKAREIKGNSGILSNFEHLCGFVTGKEIPIEFAKVFAKRVNNAMLNNGV